jgi:hypothetical protein
MPKTIMLMITATSLLAFYTSTVKAETKITATEQILSTFFGTGTSEDESTALLQMDAAKNSFKSANLVLKENPLFCNHNPDLPTSSKLFELLSEEFKRDYEVYSRADLPFEYVLLKALIYKYPCPQITVKQTTQPNNVFDQFDEPNKKPKYLTEEELNATPSQATKPHEGVPDNKIPPGSAEFKFDPTEFAAYAAAKAATSGL